MASAIASTSAVTLEAIMSALVPQKEYAVTLSGNTTPRRAILLATRERPASPGTTTAPSLEAYIHWTGSDPRLDCWIDAVCIGEPWPADSVTPPPPSEMLQAADELGDKGEDKGILTRHKKRARGEDSPAHILDSNGVAPPNAPSQPRAIASVVYGWHEIKTWYDSPYQLDDVVPNAGHASLHHTAISNVGRRSSSQAPVGRLVPASHNKKRSRPNSSRSSPMPEAQPPPPRANHRNLSQLPHSMGLGYSPPAKAKIASRDVLLPDDPAMDAEMIRAMKRPSSSSGSASNSSSSTIAVAQSLLPPVSLSDVSASTGINSNGLTNERDSSASPPTSPEQVELHKATASTPTLPAPAFEIILPMTMNTRTSPQNTSLGSSQSGRPRGAGGRFAKKEGPLKRPPRKGNAGLSISAPASTKPPKVAAAAKPASTSATLIHRELRDLSAFNRAFSPDVAELNSSTAQPVSRVGYKELQLVPATGLYQLQNGRLYVCDGCFKYMTSMTTYELHHRACKQKFPPGRKVWQRGSQTIWEVDGSLAKLWCQNLCLFGKLFIDHKYVFFDVDGFLFYVLCEGDGNRDYMVGFFSKEKVSYDDYNLACIVILPPFQKRGYGVLLIELSYELHRRSQRFRGQGIAGTPERPLSDLGLRGYLAYWTSVLIHYFRRLIKVRSLEAAQKMQEEHYALAAQRKVKKSKGWISVETAAAAAAEEPVTTSAAASAAHHVASADEETDFAIRMTVEQIAKQTALRTDDVVLALESCGLLRYIDKDVAKDSEVVLVITPEAVEQVAEQRRIKPVLLELACMLPMPEADF